MRKARAPSVAINKPTYTGTPEHWPKGIRLSRAARLLLLCNSLFFNKRLFVIRKVFFRLHSIKNMKQFKLTYVRTYVRSYVFYIRVHT